MKEKSSPVRVVPASQAKNNFGEMLRRVYEQAEPQIIERAGMPVAVLISLEDFQRLYPATLPPRSKLAVSANRQAAAQHLRALLDQMQQGSEQFSEEQVEADVMQAVRAVRRSRRKK